VTQRRVAATLDDGFRLGDGADSRDHHALGPTIKDAGGVVRVAGLTRAMGVMPRPSAATQIAAALSSEVGLCWRSMSTPSNPRAAAIMVMFRGRIWLTP
jgi:hypothetical protein